MHRLPVCCARSPSNTAVKRVQTCGCSGCSYGSRAPSRKLVPQPSCFACRIAEFGATPARDQAPCICCDLFESWLVLSQFRQNPTILSVISRYCTTKTPRIHVVGFVRPLRARDSPARPRKSRGHATSTVRVDSSAAVSILGSEESMRSTIC